MTLFLSLAGREVRRDWPRRWARLRIEARDADNRPSGVPLLMHANGVHNLAVCAGVVMPLDDMFEHLRTWHPTLGVRGGSVMISVVSDYDWSSER